MSPSWRGVGSCPPARIASWTRRRSQCPRSLPGGGLRAAGGLNSSVEKAAPSESPHAGRAPRLIAVSYLCGFGEVAVQGVVAVGVDGHLPVGGQGASGEAPALLTSRDRAAAVGGVGDGRAGVVGDDALKHLVVDTARRDDAVVGGRRELLHRAVAVPEVEVVAGVPGSAGGRLGRVGHVKDFGSVACDRRNGERCKRDESDGGDDQLAHCFPSVGWQSL